MTNPGSMAALADAAARGVQVTVVTNHREPVALTFKGWTFWETQDSGWGKLEGAGYTVVVRDCDGDFTTWRVRRGPANLEASIIAEGQCHGYEPYHFDAALIAAEAALRADVSARVAVLRGRLPR